MRTSELSERISQRLMQDIASGIIATGQHVSAQQVADRYGVSRTPVREALSRLEADGLLKRQANRGFFVAEKISVTVHQWLKDQRISTVDLYQQLANDWLVNRLPEDVTEQQIRLKYGWTKNKVTELLARAAREGWAERKEGYGWRFLPVAKTPAAFDQIYRFRLSIEPTAMLEPTFKMDRKIIAEQRRLQEHMLETDLGVMLDETLLNNGSVFHEELIKLSGNPFFLMALQRVNRMRRLMEYRVQIDRNRLVEQCTEHLEILDLLESGDLVDASYKMRQHLSGALKRKSPVAWSWASDVES
jgi:DNA-binding GntR family transcriptional regulator